MATPQGVAFATGCGSVEDKTLANFFGPVQLAGGSRAGELSWSALCDSCRGRRWVDIVDDETVAEDTFGSDGQVGTGDVGADVSLYFVALSGRSTCVRCGLGLLGREFAELVADATGVPSSHTYLVCKGKVVDLRRSLFEAGVRAGDHVRVCGRLCGGVAGGVPIDVGRSTNAVVFEPDFCDPGLVVGAFVVDSFYYMKVKKPQEYFFDLLREIWRRTGLVFMAVCSGGAALRHVGQGAATFE